MEAGKIAEAISLWLTWPSVVLSAMVVALWSGQLWGLIRKPHKTSSDLFILGVVVGFAGEVLDSVYWAIPWTASFLDRPETSYLVSIGVYFNVIFRQSFTIVAASLHVRSYCLHCAESGKPGNILGVYRMTTLGSSFLGFVYVLALNQIKN